VRGRRCRCGTRSCCCRHSSRSGRTGPRSRRRRFNGPSGSVSGIGVRVMTGGTTGRGSRTRRVSAIAESPLGRRPGQHVLGGKLVFGFHPHLFHVSE
jgi:hypothetical protein